MTTDPTSPADRAARLEALTQRRGTARPAKRPTVVEPSIAPTVGSKRRHRRHAATGGRILAGGLSAATALGLMGAMADATASTGGAMTWATDPASSANAISRAAAPADDPAAALHVAPATVAPVTASRGS
jgi:hypothetical protein